MGSKIAWTNDTWNPVTGCSKVSPGCKNCWAERMARRLAGRCGYPEAPNHFDVTLRPDRLDQPLKWRKPRRVFVCSMGDLFHENVSGNFLYKIWRTMILNQRHTFQILTKRPERMRQYLCEQWDPAVCNVHLGVTAENQECADERVPLLLQAPAAVRFVSVEPMLGPIDLLPYIKKSLDWRTNPDPEPDTIDWVIIGCESGPGRRPMQLEWAIDLVRQCGAAGTACFVKQIEINGKVSHDPAEWPEELRVREYPNA